MKFHCFFYVAAFLDCFLFSCFSRALATQRHNYTEAHVLTHGWRPNGQLNYPMTLYLVKFISSRCLYPINKTFYELLCDHHATTKLCNGNFPLWLHLERCPGNPFFDQKRVSRTPSKSSEKSEWIVKPSGKLPLCNVCDMVPLDEPPSWQKVKIKTLCINGWLRSSR